MTQNYIAGENIYFEYGDSKTNKLDKAYVANRDVTVEVELDDSHDDYPVSRVIKQEPNGNVVVQEVIDDHRFQSFHRNQSHSGEVREIEQAEEGYEEDYNEDDYDYLHSICAYCQNDHRCDHDLQMGEDDDEYEYDDEDDEYEGDEDAEEEEEEEDDVDYNDHDCQCPHHHLHYSHHHHHHHSQHYTNNDETNHRHHKNANGVPRSSLLEKQKRIIKEQIQTPAIGNFLWDFDYPEDIPDMIEFWIELPYEKKREIATMDFLKELDQIHDNQKSQGSCRLCGNRKSLIEKELEKLYNGYYNVRKLATESLDECDLNIETINAIFGIVEEEKIVEQEETTDALERELLSMADDLVKNNGENFISLIEQLDNQTKESRISNNQSGAIDEIHETGNNNAQRQFGTQKSYEESNHSEENIHLDEKSGVHREAKEEDRDEKEEEGEEGEEGEEEEEEEVEEEVDDEYEYDSDSASYSSGVSENDYTSKKRLEETYKMLQIFSSKILRKKVHDAFQAKRAEDISRSLLDEEEKEAKLKKEKEEKEKKKKEKAREKKRLQKLAKEQERKRLEKEKEENERLLREEQLRKTEEGRKRKEAEKKKREEELKLKQEEKKRRKELEMERLKKEKEEKERKRQEAKQQREEEMKKKREEKERKEKERQEKKEIEKQQMLQKQKEEQEILEKQMAQINLSQENENEKKKERKIEKQKQSFQPLAEMGANFSTPENLESQSENSTPTLLNNGNSHVISRNTSGMEGNDLIPRFLKSDLLHMNQTTLATPSHQLTRFDSTPVLESSSPASMNLLNVRNNTSALYGANVFNSSFVSDTNGSSTNPLMDGSGLSNGLPSNLLGKENGLFSSALFDSKSLSNEGTPKINEGSIWNSAANPLNNLGTRESNDPAVGRHNSIWSSGDMPHTRTSSFSWNNTGTTTLTDGLNGNTSSVNTMENNLSIFQIELIQLESFKAAARLPCISSGVYSVPLLYHYTKTLLTSSFPGLTLVQFVAALSFDLGSKLNFSFNVFKDEKNEDVVKIVKGSAILPTGGVGTMNLGGVGMDVGYVNNPMNGMNGMNSLNVYNNGLNGISGLGGLPMNNSVGVSGINNMNLLDMDGPTAEMNLMNGLNGMNPMNTMNSLNALNMNLADLNVNVNMGMNMGLNMNGNGGIQSLNPLQDYNNLPPISGDAKDRSSSGNASSNSNSNSNSNIDRTILASNNGSVATDTWKLF